MDFAVASVVLIALMAYYHMGVSWTLVMRIRRGEKSGNRTGAISTNAQPTTVTV